MGVFTPYIYILDRHMMKRMLSNFSNNIPSKNWLVGRIEVYQMTFHDI